MTAGSPQPTGFSVVITTHERPSLVVQAVESVQRQHRPADEIIVVVDGPDERARQALRHLPIRLIEQDRRGVAAARNRGVAESSSPWVCFLDDDDLWHPEMLAEAEAYVREHPDCRALNAWRWTFADAPRWDAELVAGDLDGCLRAAKVSTPTYDHSYMDICGRSYDLLLERNRCDIHTAAVARDVILDAGGFPEADSPADDWIMALKVARFAEWHTIHKRLAFVRVHDQQVTNTNTTNGLISLRAIRRVWEEKSFPTPPHRELSEYGSVYRWHVQNAVWSALLAGRFSLARETWQVGRSLLPRRADRAFAAAPPQVTFRAGRLGRSARLAADAGPALLRRIAGSRSTSWATPRR